MTGHHEALGKLVKAGDDRTSRSFPKAGDDVTSGVGRRPWPLPWVVHAFKNISTTFKIVQPFGELSGGPPF